MSEGPSGLEAERKIILPPEKGCSSQRSRTITALVQIHAGHSKLPSVTHLTHASISPAVYCRTKVLFLWFNNIPAKIRLKNIYPLSGTLCNSKPLNPSHPYVIDALGQKVCWYFFQAGSPAYQNKSKALHMETHLHIFSNPLQFSLWKQSCNLLFLPLALFKGNSENGIEVSTGQVFISSQNIYKVFLKCYTSSIASYNYTFI